jgi:hypothetical protein
MSNQGPITFQNQFLWTFPIYTNDKHVIEAIKMKVAYDRNYKKGVAIREDSAGFPRSFPGFSTEFQQYFSGVFREFPRSFPVVFSEFTQGIGETRGVPRRSINSNHSGQLAS